MIRAYIGLLGMGKTLSMVNDGVELMEKGKRVISNFPIKWKYKGKEIESISLTGKDFENSFMLESDALFLIDEASIVLPNYYWNKLPGEFLLKFAQSRKYGLDIFFTSQGYNHTVKRLRDITNEVVRCEKRKVFGGDVFVNITYNPEYFEQRIISSLDVEKRYILKRKFIFGGKIRKLYKAYDTMFKVKSSALLDIDVSKIEKEEDEKEQDAFKVFRDLQIN